MGQTSLIATLPEGIPGLLLLNFSFADSQKAWDILVRGAYPLQIDPAHGS